MHTFLKGKISICMTMQSESILGNISHNLISSMHQNLIRTHILHIIAIHLSALCAKLDVFQASGTFNPSCATYAAKGRRLSLNPYIITHARSTHVIRSLTIKQICLWGVHIQTLFFNWKYFGKVLGHRDMIVHYKCITRTSHRPGSGSRHIYDIRICNIYS